MGQVKVETVSVRKKGPVSKPQPKIEARRVVVNNQVKKLHTAAAASNRSNVSSSVTKQIVKPKQTAKATTTKPTAKASSKKAVKRLSQAKKQSKKK